MALSRFVTQGIVEPDIARKITLVEDRCGETFGRGVVAAREDVRKGACQKARTGRQPENIDIATIDGISSAFQRQTDDGVFGHGCQKVIA